MHLCPPSIERASRRTPAHRVSPGVVASSFEVVDASDETSTFRTCLPARHAGQNLPLLGEALRGVAEKLAEIAGKNRFSQVRHGACSSYSGKTPAVGVPGEHPGHWKE